MAAGLATLELVDTEGFHDRLQASSDRLLHGLADAATAHGVPLHTASKGGMFGFVFSDADTVMSFADICNADIDYFKAFFHAMLERGVYLAPSAFEAGFISAAHSEADIDATIAKASEAMASLSGKRSRATA